MQAVVRVYEWLIGAMRVLAGVAIFSVFVLICADVLVRLVGLQPWTYSTIIVEYSLLWFAMLGAPYLVRTKGHVFIDALMILLPPRLRLLSAKLSYIICILSSCVFIWYSGALLNEAITTGLIDMRAEEVPMWILLLPLPICFTFVMTEFIRYLIGPESMYGERTDVKDNV